MATLHWAASHMGATVGCRPEDISAYSMWASGAMALLLAQFNLDMIQLIGWWHSDEMLHYLHVMARPIMQGFAARMVAHGSYMLIPSPRTTT